MHAMNVTLNSILLVSIAISSYSQGVTWDSTYRPDGYDQRLAQFRISPDSKKDIIFLGNSITAGVEWQELVGNPAVRNRGISGDITFSLLARLDEITQGQPAKIFILIGINDVGMGIPDSITTNNHRRIIRYIKANSPRTKIYLQTLLPLNRDFEKHKGQYDKGPQILRINARLRKIAEEENIKLIDLYPRFLDMHGKLSATFTYDGLHLTAAGYKHWVKVLRECRAL